MCKYVFAIGIGQHGQYMPIHLDHCSACTLQNTRDHLYLFPWLKKLAQLLLVERKYFLYKWKF